MTLQVQFIREFRIHLFFVFFDRVVLGAKEDVDKQFVAIVVLLDLHKGGSSSYNVVFLLFLVFFFLNVFGVVFF